MPRIPIGLSPSDEIRDYLRRKKYRNVNAIVRDVIEEFYLILAADLVAGHSDWPVATGYSRASFYASGASLQNFASYSVYIEKNRRPVARYVRRHLDDLIERAIEFVGIPRPEPTRQRRLFRLRRLASGVFTGRTRFEVARISNLRGLNRFRRER